MIENHSVMIQDITQSSVSKTSFGSVIFERLLGKENKSHQL